MTEALVSKGTFARQQIRKLVNQEATRGNILKACQEWLIDGTRTGDTAVFCFNGHSTKIWDQDELHAALMPWDGEVTQEPKRRTFRGGTWDAFPLHTTQNLILDNEIAELAVGLAGRNAIFVLDADIGSLSHFRKCIEAAATMKRKPGVSATKKRPGGGLAVLVAEVNSPPAMKLFEEPPKGSHGVFTWFLLNRLSRKAARKDGGRIALGDLARFVEEGVKKKGFRQTPQHLFKPESFGKFTLTGEHSPAVKRNK